jgi:PBSX family phage terminase large subunit
MESTSSSKVEVLFNPFPKQVEFIGAVFSRLYNFIMFGGAIRGGKTFAGIGALILLSKKHPKSKWVIVRDSLQTLKRTTIPSFFKICPQSFIKIYNQDTQTVTFTNGSQIIFFGENYADDKELNRFKGLECNGFLLEEVNECQEKTFNKCIERAGSHIIPDMPMPLILATCNPTSNWVKQLVYDRWKLDTLPKTWLYIPSKIHDNPFIPEEYLEALKQMPRYEYQVFVEGDWELQQRTGAEFYKEFNLDSHVEMVQYNPDLPLWLSVDENVHPYFSCTVWQIEGKNATQIDELCMRNPNNTVKGLCNEIKRRYPRHINGMLITGDATSNKEDVKVEKGFNLFTLIRQELEQYRPLLRQPVVNPSVYVRGQFINTILYSNYEGIKITIGANCKESVNDWVGTKQDSDGTKQKKKIEDPVSGIRYEPFGHLTDTADYLLTTVFQQQFAKYQGHNVIPVITRGNNLEAKPERF